MLFVFKFSASSHRVYWSYLIIRFKKTYSIKLFDRRGLILKFDTMRNQSVPILVYNLSNKPITNLQIANPFSPATVSRYKVLALQKDRACRTFPLWYFFLCVNQLQATLVSRQSASGELSPSINVTLECKPVVGSVVKHEDRETSRFFTSWMRKLNLTARRNLRLKNQAIYPNCGLCEIERTELATPSVTIAKKIKIQWVHLQNCGLLSSCLHRASMKIKHFIIQQMHNI